MHIKDFYMKVKIVRVLILLCLLNHSTTDMAVCLQESSTVHLVINMEPNNEIVNIF